MTVPDDDIVSLTGKPVGHDKNMNADLLPFFTDHRRFLILNRALFIDSHEKYESV